MDDFDSLMGIELEARDKATSSLYEFTKQAWPQIESDPFSDGWHIQAISEHLEALFRGQIKKLLINVPPRTSKSTIISVCWPAWAWISRPSTQFLCASYRARLAEKDSSKCRRLISSPWYQARWGNIFQLIGDQNTKIKFENNQKGYRIATSVMGGATGEGGHFLICDDPNEMKENRSEIKRERANDWFSSTWPSRLNNRKTGAQLVVQQRVHEMDVSGFIIKNDTSHDWVKLILPMEFEKSRRAKTIILPSNPKKVWQDPRTQEGELLWPSHVGPEELRSLKIDLKTAYNVAGQLQQRPAPEGGGIIQKAWFQMWKFEKPPKLLHVIQSWDTALESKKENAYSACTTWGVFNDSKGIANIILLALWRGHVGYPELRHIAQKLYKDYRDDGNIEIKPDGNHVPDVVLVEAKVNGISLIQDMIRAGVPVFRFDPNKYGDKDARVRLITHLIECGKVWIPGRGPDYNRFRQFGETLIDMCALFPNGESRDVVDTMSQAFIRLMNSRIVTNSSDYVPTEVRKKPVPYYWGA